MGAEEGEVVDGEAGLCAALVLILVVVGGRAGCCGVAFGVGLVIGLAGAGGTAMPGMGNR